MRVSFQGEPGAYSEEALRTFFPDVDVLPCATFGEALTSVADGQADRAVLPVENSQAGSITETYDLMLQHQLWAVGEIELRVRHCLLALPGTALASLRTAHSHPQALAQTAEYLARHGLRPIAETDTAGSARMIAERKLEGAAAVASRTAATRYGLEVLAEGIETNPDNRTRFLVLAREPVVPLTAPRTSLALALKNESGALLAVLRPFADAGINITKLESRPSRRGSWEYVFYLDVDGHHLEPPLWPALEAAAKQCQWLRVLGSYTKA